MKYIVKPVGVSKKDEYGGTKCMIVSHSCGFFTCNEDFSEPKSLEMSKQETACQSFCWGKVCRPVHSMPF